MSFQQVRPWTYGLGNDSYTKSGVTWTRVDKLWGNVSGISPGPAYFNDLNGTQPTGCGSAEKGLCHIAELAAGQAAANKKAEFPGTGAGAANASVARGSGVFFTHEMAYTTAQYSAKPVKLCGACHVFKLPRMNQEGEPLNLNKDSIYVNRTSHGTVIINETIYYNTPDWAHQNVPCIRCHVHAGISE